MGINLEEYRSRIGRYMPSNKYVYQSKSKSIQNVPKNILVSVLLTTILLISLVKNQEFQIAVDKYSSVCSVRLCLSISSPSCIQQISGHIELSNFYARYTYGNRQTRGMKIAHFNKGSGYLVSKKHEIENLVSGLHPHVLGISEANLMKNQDYDDVQISDYVLHKCPTIDNPELKYSRIVVYTHKSLVCKPRPDLMNENCSAIWLQVGLPNQKQIIIGQFYREWQLLGQQDRSSNSVQAQLNRWVLFLSQWENALNSGLEVLVLGDMNINHLDWYLPIGQQSSQTTRLRPLIDELFSRIFPHSVSQCVTVATRFMQGQQPTGLDHLYTNRPDKLSAVQTQFCGGSDHKMISATRYSKAFKKSARYIQKRCYGDFDMNGFLDEVAKISWWDLYQSDDVELAVDIFSNKFLRVLDQFAPFKTIQTRTKYASWLSSDTKNLINKRNVAQSQAAASKSVYDWNKYKRIRNEVTKRLKVEKKNWQQEKLLQCVGRPGDQWQHVLGWFGWKNCSSPSQLFYNGKLISKPLEVANSQNEYFVSKIKTIQQNLPPPKSDPLGPLRLLMQNRLSTFHLCSVHPDIVENVVKKLKNSKSAGLDTIDTSVIKLALPYILPALTHIVNLSIANCQFPKQWKRAKIIPLYKKDDPLDARNYRPVAILPVLSKVVEKVVFLQISQYMESNGLMHPNHHGFRTAHSTATCLIQMYDRWVDALDNKMFTGVCFLDLSAAFDIVDHSLLVEKLRLYGFDERSVGWISSYLTGREQSVYIEGKQSEFLSVTSGVPQGSILGPLLYTIFTNELPELMHGHNANSGYYNMHCEFCGSLCCYADDSSFSYASSDLEVISRTLTAKYNEISDFMCSNKLKLNDEKTHLMLLASDKAWRSKLSHDSLALTTENGITINTGRTENLLGGIVSQNLKWTEHILLHKNSLIKQLGFRVTVLRKICHIASFKTRKMVADGLFLSKLMYLMPLWGGCEDSLLKALQVVQNKVARLVTRRGIYTPVKVLLEECGWLSVAQLVFFNTVLILFKARKTQTPKYIFEMSVSAESERYGARSGQVGKLRGVGSKLPNQLLNCNSFRWRSVNSWNRLPLELRQLDSHAIFKQKLKSWVQKNIKI